MANQCGLAAQRTADGAGGSPPGVTVSQLQPFPVMPPSSGLRRQDLTVTNLGGGQQTLVSVSLMRPVAGLALSDALGITTWPAGASGVLLSHGDAYVVTVTATPLHIGLMRGVVELRFGGLRPFSIFRVVSAACNDPEVAALGPQQPYRRKERRRPNLRRDFIRGQCQ